MTLLGCQGCCPKELPRIDGAAAAGVTLKENERNHIPWTLEKTGGKIRGKGGAAELLESNPSTLHFRMKKLGIK